MFRSGTLANDGLPTYFISKEGGGGGQENEEEEEEEKKKKEGEGRRKRRRKQVKHFRQGETSKTFQAGRNK